MKRIILLFILTTTIILGNATDDLFVAVKELNVEGVKKSIENSANVNSIDQLGNTPLDYLIKEEDFVKKSKFDYLIEERNFDVVSMFEITKILINEDANINISKKFKENILFYLISNISWIDPILYKHVDGENSQNLKEVNYFKLIFDTEVMFFKFIVDTGINLDDMKIQIDNASFNLLDYTTMSMFNLVESSNNSNEHSLEEIVEILIDKDVKPQYTPNILLIIEVILGNEKIVQKMLDLGGNVNYLMGELSPAYLAAEYNNVEMLKFLEEKGADLDGCTKEYKTPLFAAVKNGSLDAVRYLVEKGAYVNLISKDEIPLIMEAIYNYSSEENKEIIKILLKNEYLEINCKIDMSDNLGYAFSPLSLSEDLEILEILLEKGADVNLKSNLGTTAIMNTVNIDKVNLLLENGANINEVDNDNNSILMTNLKNLKDSNNFSHSENTHFINTSYIAEVTNVSKLLIQKGVDIGIINKEGYDAFLYTAESDCMELLEILIEKGTNIKIKNKKGENALLLAVKTGNYEISKLLIEKGLKINTTDNEGITPLMRAVMLGNIELINLLIEKGADLDAMNLNKKNALDLSKELSNKEITELLIKKGAK